MLPVLAALGYVRSFGVNVPFLDQWDMVPLFPKVASATLGLSDLFSFHNEHIMALPMAIMLGLAALTRYNVMAELYLIVAVLFAELVLLFVVFRRSFPGKSLAYFIPVPFLVFSLRQHENMLWGFQIVFVLPALLGAAAFGILSRLEGRPSWGAFVASALFAAGASVSAAQGLMVWPAGLFQILMAPIERAIKSRMAIAWASIGAIVWTAYLLGYERPMGHPSPLYFLSNPAGSLGFFLRLVGGALSPDKDLALPVGIAICALSIAAIAFLGRKGRQLSGFWLALALFSSLVLLSITVGRAGISTAQAMASRYSTYSIFLVVSLYMVLLCLFQEGKRAGRGMLICLVAMAIVSVPFTYREGINKGREDKRLKETIASAVLHFERYSDDELGKIYVKKERAEELRRLGYSVFSKE